MLPCFPLQRCKMKLFAMVPFDNELDTPVAQVANPIKENDLFFFHHFPVNVWNYLVKMRTHNPDHQ